MRGIYVHIPFCISKCYYCDFNSYSGMLSKAPEYISALLKEASGYCGHSADTLYIGGGTPTALPKEQLCQLIEGLYDIFNLRDLREFTVEMNPRTADYSYICHLKRLGVNRISLGAQSFDPILLETLGRIHRPEDIYDAVSMCKKAGIENISLDLMFSLPGQTMENWKHSLSGAIGCGINHISCYGLKIEEGTPFFVNGVTPLPEDLDRDMYHYCVEMLQKNGFEQYEISNFAKNGAYSQHNLKYWHCKEYFGLGAGAHRYLSVNGKPERGENARGINEYIEMISKNGEATKELISLSENDMLTEKIIMGLRLREGINEKLLNSKKIHPFITGGFMEKIGENLRFTLKGYDVSNAILAQLI